MAGSSIYSQNILGNKRRKNVQEIQFLKGYGNIFLEATGIFRDSILKNSHL